MANNILQYESEIWATADLLRGIGIKESEWPAYMMPFFALIMIESRLLRLLDDEINIAGGEEKFYAMREDDRLALLIDSKQGYNKYLIEHHKTLKEICANDKTFEIDFDSYLKGFDEETKDLLGVDPGEEGERFLNIKNYISILKTKKVLFAYVRKWSEIDLQPYSNSDITTLEEHIKRRWADMSAETAGEQYTPDDVIALMAEIVASKIEPKETLLRIYDPACGGGNLLFGVEDRIKESFPDRYTQTFGQEINDALYALAKIESRFREDSKIEDGNTLVEDAFYNDEFDVSVANPPFGVDWKGYQGDIRKDKTNRYKFLPSVSDGQMLFTQHLIGKMAHDGVAVIVHNGSTLFSGDAGSAESNIRKWMLDSDIVEAVIQLPTDEFFNTGIYTYLWVLNKNKKPHQKDRVMLLNASQKFKQLKKSKGAKRKEVDEASRREIVETLKRFEDAFYEETGDAAQQGRSGMGGDSSRLATGGINSSLSSLKSAEAVLANQPEGLSRHEAGIHPDDTPRPYARVFDKEYFYYNKQAILLTNVDEQGKALPESLKLTPIKLENGEREFTEFNVNELPSHVILSRDSGEESPSQSGDSSVAIAPSERHDTLYDYFEKDIKPFIASLDYKEQPLVVTTPTAKYYYDNEQETLIKESKGKKEALGCGKIVVKATYKKATKTQGERFEVTVELAPDTEKDYEIIPFRMDAAQNQAEIAAFTAKYVSKPFEYLENVVGVEINFNKIFYKPENLRNVTHILDEIKHIDNELKSLEDGLGL